MKEIFLLLVILAGIAGMTYGFIVNSMGLFFGCPIGAIVASILLNMGSYAQKDANRRKLGRRYID